MSILHFGIILPSYLFLPDGEYKINFNGKYYHVKSKNNYWFVNRMNSYGEILPNLLISEDLVIDPESLKLKINHDPLFKEKFTDEISENRYIYFPEKQFTTLILDYNIDDTNLSKDIEEQNNFIKNKIKNIILPIINKFLEAYRFYIAEEDPTNEKFRINNIENITFFDLFEKNSFITLIKDDRTEINFKGRILSSRFGADFPFFMPTIGSLKKFREKLLRNYRNSHYEILWGEVKHSIFKKDWRKAIILADSLLELLKKELNGKKKLELITKIESNSNNLTEVEKLQHRVIKLLNENEERGVKFFLDTQIPIFHNDLFLDDELTCLREIHKIRNNIIHNAMRRFPENLENKFNTFRNIIYKLIKKIYNESIDLVRLHELPLGIAITPISSGEYGLVKPFQYKTQLLLSQLNHNFRRHTEELINQRINEFDENSFVLEDFSNRYNIKIAKKNNNYFIFIKYITLDFTIYFNLFRDLEEKFLDSQISPNKIKFIIGSFIIPNQLRERIRTLLDSLFSDIIDSSNIQIELIQSSQLFPSIMEEINFHEISFDFRYLDFLNLLAIEFMRSAEYGNAYMILSNAENISGYLGSKEQEAKAKYNIACLYSLKNNLELSKSYLRQAIECNPGFRNNWREDEHFRNLIESGFEI